MNFTALKEDPSLYNATLLAVREYAAAVAKVPMEKVDVQVQPTYTQGLGLENEPGLALGWSVVIDAEVEIDKDLVVPNIGHVIQQGRSLSEVRGAPGYRPSLSTQPQLRGSAPLEEDFVEHELGSHWSQSHLESAALEGEDIGVIEKAEAVYQTLEEAAEDPQQLLVEELQTELKRIGILEAIADGNPVTAPKWEQEAAKKQFGNAANKVHVDEGEPLIAVEGDPEIPIKVDRWSVDRPTRGQLPPPKFPEPVWTPENSQESQEDLMAKFHRMQNPPTPAPTMLPVVATPQPTPSPRPTPSAEERFELHNKELNDVDTNLQAMLRKYEPVEETPVPSPHPTPFEFDHSGTLEDRIRRVTGPIV
jgi:hypothetical protein